MDNAGSSITIDALAREAGVSRSWIYSQPDLRAEAERLRARPPGPGRLVPDRQRSSDASLLRRVEIATQRILELETDNKLLRHALAEALGEALGERRVAPNCGDTPRPRVSSPNEMNSYVTDTVRNANHQLTALIILLAQDNHRVDDLHLP